MADRITLSAAPRACLEHVSFTDACCVSGPVHFCPSCHPPVTAVGLGEASGPQVPPAHRLGSGDAAAPFIACEVSRSSNVPVAQSPICKGGSRQYLLVGLLRGLGAAAHGAGAQRSGLLCGNSPQDVAHHHASSLPSGPLVVLQVGEGAFQKLPSRPLSCSTVSNPIRGVCTPTPHPVQSAAESREGGLPFPTPSRLPSSTVWLQGPDSSPASC